MFARLISGLIAAVFLAFASSAFAAARPAVRPLVVILADPRGVVATDLLAPYAILAESGVVDVRVVSPTAAPVRLTPGWAWVKPQMTLAELARARPGGPDVVIVPAMSVDDDPVRSAWLKAQLARGTRLMSICNGARVLAAAGVLDGRQATVHWYSRGKMAKRHPKVDWRQDRRWITDGPVTTTAGISASEPATLELLRQLAGEATMTQTARRLGLALPDPRHDGRRYHLTAAGMGVTIGNTLAFWGHEQVAVPLSPGFDEIAFGTALDGWSRTWRSTAWAVGAPATVSRHGLTVWRASERPKRFDRTFHLPAGDAMTATFARIREAYGEPTARFVALQFEHPWGAVAAR